MNRDGYSLTPPQLHVIIERCVGSGTVTKVFDIESAGPPLLIANMSRGQENVAPKKRPRMDDADNAFESDSSLANCMTPPQHKNCKAKETKQKSSSVKTCEKKPDRSLTALNEKKMKKKKNLEKQAKKQKLADNGATRTADNEVRLMSARVSLALRDQAVTGDKKCLPCYLLSRNVTGCRTDRDHKARA